MITSAALFRAALLAVSAALATACAEPELPDLGPPLDAPLRPASPPPPAPAP